MNIIKQNYYDKVENLTLQKMYSMMPNRSISI